MPGFLKLLLKGFRGEPIPAAKMAGLLVLVCLIGGTAGGVCGWFASPLWRFGFIGRWLTCTAGVAGYFGALAAGILFLKNWDPRAAAALPDSLGVYLAFAGFACALGLGAAWHYRTPLGEELFVRAETFDEAPTE